MNKLLHKLFDIREGEEQIASLMFVYIFLVIASLLIVKPVRNSLFLTHFGISQLPYAFILVAITAAFITNIYSKWAKKIRLNLLIQYTLLVSIASLVICWLLLNFNYQAGWFYYGFYIWVALFGVITTSQFWLLANYVFNAREAKRLFGFIGAGAISGGIFGGYLTKFLAPIIGTDNMLLFCIVSLIICILILREVWKKSARYNYKERILQEKRIKEKKSSDNPLKLIMNSRHLTFLAGIVGVGVIVANLVDYQFSSIASRIITNEDQLTAFFGFWLSNLSIASLFIQLFLTGRILKIFGVTTSLFFLPVGIFIGAFGILIYPALLSAVVIKVSDGAFKQSINKAGYELLALPISSNIKNKTKAFIDVFVDSLATGIGGILLIFFTNQLGFSEQFISLIIVVFIVFWFYLIVRVKREYLNSFRIALEKRSIDLNYQNVNIEDASIFESLTRVLNGINERKILYVLQLIENVKNVQFIPFFKKLIHHHSGEVKIQVLKIIDQYDNIDLSDEVGKLIQHENYEVKVEAIRYLFHHSKNGRAEVQELCFNPDYKIRSAAFMCAAYEYRDNSEFRKNIDIKKLFDQFVDQCYQMDHNKSEIHFMKIILARFIGVVGEAGLYPFLQNLLCDNCHEIVQAAITGAGMTRDPMFINILIKYLSDKFLRKYAREALAGYQEEIVDTLAEHIEDCCEERKVRLRIPRVLALIDSQKSVNVLIRNLKQSDLMLRYEIIKALNKLKVHFPNLKFDKQLINSQIFNETKYYYKIINLLCQQNGFQKLKNSNASKKSDSDRVNNAQKLLLKALQEKLEFNLERIFRLLGLRYVQEDMYNSYLGIISKKSDLQANAIEFLDNILDASLKKVIIPIVEENSPNLLRDKALHFLGFDLPSEHECLEFLLQGEDNWLKVCTLFLITELKRDRYNDIVTKLVDDSDPIVKETAQYALERLGL